jgi:hypothetical protein
MGQGSKCLLPHSQYFMNTESWWHHDEWGLSESQSKLMLNITSEAA